MVVIAMQYELQLPVQSVSITTKAASSIQDYVIKFVSDFRHVGGFPRVVRFPPLTKLTDTI
jgi:hypothetical protein